MMRIHTWTLGPRGTCSGLIEANSTHLDVFVTYIKGCTSAVGQTCFWEQLKTNNKQDLRVAIYEYQPKHIGFKKRINPQMWLECTLCTNVI